jgi:hypothetical protein
VIGCIPDRPYGERDGVQAHRPIGRTALADVVASDHTTDAREVA